MNPIPSPSAPTLPELSPSDKDRIEAWFDNDARLTDVAQAVGINVLELARWADEPQIVAALDAVERIAKRRTATLRAEAEHAALSRLLSITRFCEQPELARRAANAILGLTRTPKRPARDLKPTDPALESEPPQRPSDPPLNSRRPHSAPVIDTPQSRSQRQELPHYNVLVPAHLAPGASGAVQMQASG